MRPQVLVVDDDRLTLRRLTRILESEDFDVQAVASAREATIVLQRRAFDLLMTDMNMKTPTAVYGVCQAGKKESRQPEIVILVSSLSTGDWKRQGVKAISLNGHEIPDKMIATVQGILDAFVRVRESSMDWRRISSSALRVIVPHRTENVIDGFTCSTCQWFYSMKDAKPFEISWQESRRACEAFDGHVCSDDLPELKAG